MMNYGNPFVDHLLDKLRSQRPNPATPAAIRKIAVDFLSFNPTPPTTPTETIENVKAMLGIKTKKQSGFRPSWSSLYTAAAILRRKDGVEFAIGEFLHMAIGASKKEIKMRGIANAWRLPATCALCYRLSGHQKFCSLHDRQQNEAGYRKGRRLHPIAAEHYQRLRQQREQLPQNFTNNDFTRWIRFHTPCVYSLVGNSTPAEALLLLDDKSRNGAIAKYRASEHHKMISRSSILVETKLPWTIEIFLYRAEGWARAENHLKHGGARPNSGGRRSGAGRPRKKSLVRAPWGKFGAKVAPTTPKSTKLHKTKGPANGA